MFLRIVAVVVQTMFFMLVFMIGSFLPGLAHNTIPMWRVAAGPTHDLVWNGPVTCLIVFLLVVAVEAAAKRFRSAAPITTISFILAFVLAFAAKLPYIGKATM